MGQKGQPREGGDVMKTRATVVWTMNTWLLVIGALVLWDPQSVPLNFRLDARGQRPVLVAQSFGAQAVPLPGDPGQPRNPALMQPSPPVRIEIPAPPVPSAPSVREDNPSPLARDLPSPGGEGREGGEPKVPQVTSFPELTEGVGDSRELLAE